MFTSKNEYRISTLKFHPSDPNIFICGGFGPEVKAWDIRNCKVTNFSFLSFPPRTFYNVIQEGRECG